MYAFIFKLEFTDNTIRSIKDLLFFQFIINNDNKLNIKYLNELLLGYWSLTSDYYHLKPIKNVIITYRLLRAENGNKQLLSKKMTNLNNFSDYSMDIKLYKHLTSSNPNSINLYKKLFKNNIYTNPSVQKEF